MVRLVSFIAFIVVALLGVTFAILNSDIVSIHYYLGTQRMPLSVLMLIALVVGVVIGLGACLPMVLRLKMEIRRLHRDHLCRDRS